MIPQRNEWIFDQIINPLEDKEYMVKHNILSMLNKTLSMFSYKGLPETIPKKDLEIQLQVGGYNIWKEVDGNLYTFTGGLGGKPNPYYLPTIATVANPALNFSKNLDIDKNCVVMLNDYFYVGLMPLFNKYARLLTEAELSLKYTIINARTPSMIEADNDGTYESAVEFIKKVVDGKDYGVVSTKEFFDGIRTHELYKQLPIIDLIEGIQYIKGSWYNEVGLNAAFNMKREAINEAEATLNEDILYPLIDTMVECRQIGLDKVNKMYGTNITVELNSVWEQNKRHEELTFEKIESEVKNMNISEEKVGKDDEDN